MPTKKHHYCHNHITKNQTFVYKINSNNVFGSFLVKERKGRERKGREKKRMEEKGKKP